MITILVVYHSQTGRTKKMAQSVAMGMDAIANARAVLKEARKTSLEDLLACDGLPLGSLEYFGYMAGTIKELEEH